MYRIVRGIRTGTPIIQVFSLINEYFPEFRAFSFGVIIKDEQVIDPRMQGSGNIVSEFEGWIILSLLQKDDSLPSNADFSGEVILREALAGAVFLDPGDHQETPGLLSLTDLTLPVVLDPMVKNSIPITDREVMINNPEKSRRTRMQTTVKEINTLA